MPLLQLFCQSRPAPAYLRSTGNATIMSAVEVYTKRENEQGTAARSGLQPETGQLLFNDVAQVVGTIERSAGRPTRCCAFSRPSRACAIMKDQLRRIPPSQAR